MPGKKVKNILFTSNSTTFTKRQLPLIIELENRGYNVTTISYSKQATEILRSKGKKVEYIIDYFDNYNLKNVEKELEKYEEKYDTNMNLIITGDKNYTWKKRATAKRDLVKHFKFWEYYLIKNKVDVIFGAQERFIDMVPRIVGAYFGSTQLAYKQNMFPGTFTVVKDPIGRWHTLNKFWGRNKNRKLTSIEYKRAKKYWTNTKKKKLVAPGNQVFIAPQLNDLRLFIISLYNNWRYEKFRNPYANLYHIGKEQTLRVLRKPISKVFTEKPIKNEKYIYFPLTRSGDAQILLRAPQYYNQLELIKIVSRYIPTGYKLYVKQHPTGEGEFDLRDLNSIRKIENVRLIDTYMNTHEILKNTSAVITINSNTGIEALLYKKPTILLGNVYYDISNMFLKVRDFYELPGSIKKALKMKFNDDEILKFINALLESTHKGHTLFVRKFNKYLYDAKNIKNIVDGFEKEFKLL